jgi:hypothetical protein
VTNRATCSPSYLLPEEESYLLPDFKSHLLPEASDYTEFVEDGWMKLIWQLGENIGGFCGAGYTVQGSEITHDRGGRGVEREHRL